jgi:hypothetical protein
LDVPTSRASSSEVLSLPIEYLRGCTGQSLSMDKSAPATAEAIVVKSGGSGTEASLLFGESELLSQCNHVMPLDIIERHVEYSSVPHGTESEPAYLPFDISSHMETRSAGGCTGFGFPFLAHCLSTGNLPWSSQLVLR